MYRVIIRTICMICLVVVSCVVSRAQDTISLKPLCGEIKLLKVERNTIEPCDIVVKREVSNNEIPRRIASRINIYDMPYSRSASYPNWRRLWLNTATLCGAGIGALAVLEVLPEDATNWNRKELRRIPPFQRWFNHVKLVAHWDGDNPIFNYVLHPYGGAAYYMCARSQGFNFWGSALYCFCISTFFWEYGVEAFMEIPSIQDLIITPIAGALLGECFYKLKRRIVDDGYTLWGSSVLGNVVAFLIDPVNEVVGLFAGNSCRQRLKEKLTAEITFTPIINPVTPQSQYIPTYGFAITATF